MVARGSEVQTARVREPAARPDFKPAGASSTTRPIIINVSNKTCMQREERTYTSWGLRHIAVHQPEKEQDRVFLQRHHSKQ